MKKNKVDVIWGEAKLSKPGEIVVSETKKAPMLPQNPIPKGVQGPGTYTAKHIIVATGARPRALPGIEPDGKLIWTYFEAMVPPAMPKSLIVMGSGAIGIEFASFYRTHGRRCDGCRGDAAGDAGGRCRKSPPLPARRFEKQGMKILTSTKVTKVVKGANSVTATVEDDKGAKQEITAERMISAVGVVGNIENLGLEALGHQDRSRLRRD